jgi:TonB family protein
MKKLILVSLVLLFFNDLSAQSEKYTYLNLMRPSASQDKLKDANRLLDICPNMWQYIGIPTKLNQQLDKIKKEEFPLSYHTYPPSGYSMILDFVSIEITNLQNEKPFAIKSTGEYFTNEQKKLLLSLETGTSFVVNIQFKIKEKYKQQFDDEQLFGVITMALMPAKSAQYPGSIKKFNEYLDLKVFNQVVNSTDLARIALMQLKFTIDKNGQVSNVILQKGSGKPVLDNLVLTAFKSMPKWQAAENVTGNKIEQQFDFKFGSDGC